ncbi:hypothetical protein [Pseudanabaena yagii]|uniref:Uncharacterized protein n=1 Tax=Pseudanabaena yagii GIHE-NHR1 TaxID=2722753 RepID=A0ABX1LWA7_9CYAN|nr:hypothetical protein [Pseudanabaena yagii]NMF60470.1 hypothetical protein [Pseudanabaena yagii GIHE-NHR1]
MKSYSAYFVRSESIENARKIFGKRVEPLPNSPWLLCDYQPDDELPDDEVLFGEESLTEAKSGQLGEIFFVYGDTSVDWFVYEHASDGRLLRKLVWYTLPDDVWNSGWILVAGEPEDWEATLFRSDGLARHLELESQKLKDQGHADKIPAMEAEVRQLWDLKQIIKGKRLPFCDGTVAMLVEESYGINRFDNK